MKRFSIYTLIIAALFALSSCDKDELSPISVIKVQTTEPNQFDKWLKETFLLPYNIEFKYRYEINETDMNFYTVPPTLDNAIIMAHLVKYLCVDTYDEVAGVDFTRGYFPKMFYLNGVWEYLNNGTYILGTAEGGKKIMLSGVNFIHEHLGNADDLNYYYIKTIHHEFTHIINQTTPYQTDFKLVTQNGYVADNWSSAPYNKEYLQNGYISAYAQHSDGEDFAEMMSIYITNPQSWWNEQINNAGKGANAINAKLGLVKKYMEETWNIDMDKLREVVLRRQDEVASGKVDLTDITTKED